MALGNAMTSNDAVHAVALVVDPKFGDRLAVLAARLHVWIIDTPENHLAAAAIWSENKNHHSLERGTTTFRADPTSPPDESVASILETVDLHNGEYSHTPPWSVLEVFGANPTPQLVDALAGFGFLNIASTHDGFRAWRNIRGVE